MFWTINYYYNETAKEIWLDSIYDQCELHDHTYQDFFVFQFNKQYLPLYITCEQCKIKWLLFNQIYLLDTPLYTHLEYNYIYIEIMIFYFVPTSKTILSCLYFKSNISHFKFFVYVN